MTACGPIQVRGPMRTCGPMTLKVRRSTSGASCAPARHDGARIDHGRHRGLAASASDPAHHDLALRHFLSATSGRGGEAPDALERALAAARLEHQLIARHHRPAEARLVDADEVEARVVVRESRRR